jgi:hypothetical protein
VGLTVLDLVVGIREIAKSAGTVPMAGLSKAQASCQGAGSDGGVGSKDLPNSSILSLM